MYSRIKSFYIVRYIVKCIKYDREIFSCCDIIAMISYLIHRLERAGRECQLRKSFFSFFKKEKREKTKEKEREKRRAAAYLTSRKFVGIPALSAREARPRSPIHRSLFTEIALETRETKFPTTGPGYDAAAEQRMHYATTWWRRDETRRDEARRSETDRVETRAILSTGEKNDEVARATCAPSRPERVRSAIFPYIHSP